MALHAKAKAWSLVREPDAGNLPVRFDERDVETGVMVEPLRVGFESHEARAMRRTRSMTEAA